MTQPRITRRGFLIGAGAGLGVCMLAGAGLSTLYSFEGETDMPQGAGEYKLPPYAPVSSWNRNGLPAVAMPDSTLGASAMPDKILVAYASQAGSTAGVAEAIGKTLAESGLAVDVRPMREVGDLQPYRAVVAGSAIHGSRWLPEAMQFMKTNQACLRRKPFASFMVCITLSMANAEQLRTGVAGWMQPVRDLVPPVSEGLFAGALDFSKLPVTPNTLLMHLPVMLGAWKLGDHRDWNAIRSWAESLKPLLTV